MMKSLLSLTFFILFLAFYSNNCLGQIQNTTTENKATDQTHKDKVETIKAIALKNVIKMDKPVLIHGDSASLPMIENSSNSRVAKKNVIKMDKPVLIHGDSASLPVTENSKVAKKNVPNFQEKKRVLRVKE